MEARYLCPICDHELSGRSFCPDCRRFRRHPIVYRGGALPNELDLNDYTDLTRKTYEKMSGSRIITSGKSASGRKASGKNTSGRNVSFGTKTFSAAASKSRAASAQTKKQDRMPNEKYADFYRDCETPHTYGVPGVDPHKKKKNSGCGGCLLAILIVLICLAAFTMTVRFLLEDDTWEDRTDTGSRVEINYEDEDTYAKAILEAGLPCTGYCHFDIDGDLFNAQIVEGLQGAFPEDSRSIMMTGGVQQFYENEHETYYLESYYLYLNDVENSYIYILHDAVTGELLEVYGSSDDAARLKTLLKTVVLVICPEEDPEEIEQATRDAWEKAADEDYFELSVGDADLWLFNYEDRTYFFVDCLPSADKYR